MLINKLIVKAQVKLIRIMDKRGQNTVEYIVGAAIIVLLLFAAYKLFKDKKVFEGVFNWFKSTFNAKAK